MTAAKGYGGYSKGTVAEANAHIAALETRLEVLEAAVGDTINAPDINKTPKELTNGQWPLFWNVYQLRTVVGEIFAQLAGTPATPPPPAPNIELPPPVYAPIGAYGLPIQAMTQAQIDAFVPALTAGIGNGLSAEQVTKITSDVKAGVYAVQDVPTIDSVKYLYYNGGNQAALKPYLSAIDQRDLATNQLLPLTDPRVIQVSGISGGSTPVPIPAPTGPATVIEGDLIVKGRAVFGGPFSSFTKEATEATVQILGNGNAEIYFEGNRNGTGPQLAGRVAVCLIGIGGYEGNVHILQNYKGGGKFGGLPVDDNRPVSVIVLDYAGTLTGCRKKPGQDYHGNNWWIMDDVTAPPGQEPSTGNKEGSVRLTSAQQGVKVQLAQTPAGAGYANSTDIR